MNTRCKIIGIIGETGSGKSTISRFLTTKLDVLHIEGDRVGHIILNNKKLQNSLIIRYGEDIVVDGSVDRSGLGNIVFNSRKELEFLNSLTHPLIKDYILQLIKERQVFFDYIVIDGAALIEAGILELCDRTLYCFAPREIRLARLVQGRGIDRDRAGKMINAQPSCDFYKDHADMVIDTTKEEYETELLDYFRSLNEKIK